MQLLIDFLPVIAFFVTFKLTDMRTAIMVIMAVMTLQVVITYAVKRTVSRMLLTSAALVVGLGGISLLLKNPLFFKWKPTILNWVFAAVCLGSQFVGERPIVQRLFESLSKDEITLSGREWKQLNLMWVAFFLFSGAANIYVAYRFSEATWVNFKLFGLLGMMLAFVFAQALWLSSRASNHEGGSPPGA